MVEWFHERYIARTEHQQIVDYYRKLVAELHRKVSELRAQVDAMPLEAVIIGEPPPDGRPRPYRPEPPDYGGNVISFEAHRRARARF